MADALEFLANRLGSGESVEKITVEDRLVTVRFVSEGYSDAACTLAHSEERSAVFRQAGVTFDIAAMCA